MLYSRWMLHLAVAFTLLQGSLVDVPMLWTSVLDDTGQCYGISLGVNTVSVRVYSTFETMWLYIIVLSALIFCYGGILVKLKQVNLKVGPGNPVDYKATTGSHQAEGMNRSQVNVIKTMIIISASYAVTSFLYFFGYVALSYDSNTALGSATSYYVEIGLFFLNDWLDPFIYVLSNKDVRQQFVKYISCIKSNPGPISLTL